MLQQTQVARVIEVYRRFMRQFPSVRALAAADEQDVLAAWQGMGYYRRARHLHQAAKMIVQLHGGRVSSDIASLRTLPGVGRYTAGAIASIVFNKPEPIVDGNVIRVLARWHGKRGSMGNRKLMMWAWTQAEKLVNVATRPGVFNEAMMELGATVCTPRNPKCNICPVATWCIACRQGRQQSIPAAKRRVERQTLHHHAVVITRNGKIIVEKRGERARGNGQMKRGLWEGLWQVPTVESTTRLSDVDIQLRLPFTVAGMIAAGGFTHVLSHRRIQFHIYRARSTTKRGVWHMPRDLDALPMSNAQRKILQLTAIGNSSK